MTIQLNHTLVHSRNARESAHFYAEILGLPARTLLGSIDDSSVLDEAHFTKARLVVSALQIEDTNNLGSVFFSHNRWLLDIDYNAFGMTIPVTSSGVVGISLTE